MKYKRQFVIASTRKEQDGHDGLITCNHTVLRHTDTVPCHADVALLQLGEA